MRNFLQKVTHIFIEITYNKRYAIIRCCSLEATSM